MMGLKNFIFEKNYKYLLFIIFFCMINFIFCPYPTHSETKSSINGSGLKIPRVVSLKNSLTFMRTGPGKEYPIKFEINQKAYPVKIVAEFNNWRKVNTKDNLSGWIHTQLLSSFRTGLVNTNTTLKRRPSVSSKTLANLLPDLLIKVKKCKIEWCKIEVIKNKNFVGWVKKSSIWGSVNK
tara:strand:+ start:657 stop:1196 length:540 start_codon:yes stop_codon:yes gene_type:complete